jgi:hypothetical protein
MFSNVPAAKYWGSALENHVSLLPRALPFRTITQRCMVLAVDTASWINLQHGWNNKRRSVGRDRIYIFRIAYIINAWGRGTEGVDLGVAMFTWCLKAGHAADMMVGRQIPGPKQAELITRTVLLVKVRDMKVSWSPWPRSHSDRWFETHLRHECVSTSFCVGQALGRAHPPAKKSDKMSEKVRRFGRTNSPERLRPRVGYCVYIPLVFSRQLTIFWDSTVTCRRTNGWIQHSSAKR